MIKHVISISGGKDSTAMYLLALEQGIDFTPVFADTGNEHEITYEYVRTLHEKTGGPEVVWVKADLSDRVTKRRMFVARDQRTKRVKNKKIRYSNKAKRKILTNLHPTGNPFLDLCQWKGRFPSTRRRFCSFELKQIPIFTEIFLPLLEQGHLVFSWQGVRRDESKERESLPVREIDKNDKHLINYRPILDWTFEDVFAIHKRHGIKPNPLYLLGFSRVGCMPCINSRKEEVRVINARFPGELARVEEWESVVSLTSKRGVSTFFAADKTPGTGDTRSHIKAVINWSKTAYGGKQYLLPFGEPACSSVYGLCE